MLLSAEANCLSAETNLGQHSSFSLTTTSNMQSWQALMVIVACFNVSFAWGSLPRFMLPTFEQKGHHGRQVCDSEDWRKTSLKLIKEVQFAGLFEDLQGDDAACYADHKFPLSLQCVSHLRGACQGRPSLRPQAWPLSTTPTILFLTGGTRPAIQQA